MTTNATTSARTAARFFASTTPNADGLYVITDRDAKGTAAVTAYIKGRAAARNYAAILTAIDPSAIRPTDEPKAPNLRDTKKAAKAAAKAAKPAKAKPAPKADATPTVRTSHADCGHVSTKLARAICRRDRAKADA